jgi:O-antigen/teichoic acid export membrane protein
MLAEFLTGFTSDQAYLVLVAGLLSGVAYGGFRAAFNLMGPVLVILLAGGNIGLPEAARRTNADDPKELARFARRLSLMATSGIAAIGVVVAVAGSRLLRLLYGPQFGRFGLLATLAAVQYVMYALSFGQGIALKAAGRLRRLWRVRAVVALASLSSVFVLVRWLGTDGAGWGGAATGVYYSAGVWWLYHREITHGHAVVRRSDTVPTSDRPLSGPDIDLVEIDGVAGDARGPGERDADRRRARGGDRRGRRRLPAGGERRQGGRVGGQDVGAGVAPLDLHRRAQP